MEESVIFTFPYETNRNHVTEPSAVGHVISEWHWKKTFNFIEIVNRYRLKRETVCQIMIFISKFTLKVYRQFWKYFHSMVLGVVDRGYCKKNGVLKVLAKIFGLSAFKGLLVLKRILSDTTYVFVHSHQI